MFPRALPAEAERKRAMSKRFASIAAAGSAILWSGAALADQPHPWQWRFQEAATGIMQDIEWFEVYTLWFIIPITLFVLALLAYCIWKFRASANPTPSRTSHNTLIEVIWTVAPVLILLFIAVPSFQLLTAQYTPVDQPQITIKATGNQWYWGYEYQGEQPLSFDSNMLAEVADLKAKNVADADIPRIDLGKEDIARYPRLLAVDNEIVVPVNVTTRVLVTAADVMHAFAMPAFGVKTDAVPGRINEIWFKPEKEGLYYGQCSELCGKDHAFMPIAIRVVNQAQYDTWFAAAKTDVKGANKALLAATDGVNKVASAGN
jgi:cytochrome c oxidase subunit 2